MGDVEETAVAAGEEPPDVTEGDVEGTDLEAKKASKAAVKVWWFTKLLFMIEGARLLHKYYGALSGNTELAYRMITRHTSSLDGTAHSAPTTAKEISIKLTRKVKVVQISRFNSSICSL